MKTAEQQGEGEVKAAQLQEKSRVKTAQQQWKSGVKVAQGQEPSGLVASWVRGGKSTAPAPVSAGGRAPWPRKRGAP